MKSNVRQARFVMLFSVLLLQTFTQGGHAQNLVPNPSFEQYSSCPVFASQLDLAAPWFNPASGTPEYFNGCAAFSSWVSVPSQATGGFQYARTGQGYAGIYILCTDIPENREYIEVALMQPLQAGHCYQFEMYVNQPNDHAYISDGIGAYLCHGELRVPHASVIPVVPQFSNPSGNILSDTLGWTRVSGYYTASGGEDHLLIGNYKTDAHTNYSLFNPNVWYTNSAYLYIDDVSLTELDITINLGNDTTLCPGQQYSLIAGSGWDSWIWNDGTTGQTLIVSHPGTYWIKATLGGCAVRDTVRVDFLTIPPVQLPEDTALCSGDALVLDVSTPGASYLWSDGYAEPRRIIKEPGYFEVFVYNRCGGDTGDIRVSYKDCFCDLTMPNVFTPNDDGLNDVFGPLLDCRLEEYHLMIFNRWGGKVFETTEKGGCWNGNTSNGRASEGVYYWSLSYVGNDNGQLIRRNTSGLLHLIR